jgi:hypothetical protein
MFRRFHCHQQAAAFFSHNIVSGAFRVDSAPEADCSGFF